jgi:hypothetical protein
MTKKVVRLTESDLEKIVRRVIKESMGVGFMSGEPNGLKIKKMETKEQSVGVPAQDSKEKYKNLVAKVESYFPFDSQELKTLYNKMKEKPGTYNLNDTMQPFLSKNVQDLLGKVNPNGYKTALQAAWRRYIDLNGRDLDQATQEGIYAAAINDLLTAKGGLLNKAAELSGLAATYTPWAKQNMGLIDNWAKQAGLIA